MFKNIYRELVAIRKELQSIRNAMESVKEKKKVFIGADFAGEGTMSYSSIVSLSDWENALTRLEKANHQDGSRC